MKSIKKDVEKMLIGFRLEMNWNLIFCIYTISVILTMSRLAWV
jgi:hypothetical protein